MKSAYLQPYNPLWPKRFDQESELIIQATTLNLKLFHIGSTAVEGLYAKDCIDILGSLANIEQAKGIIKALGQLGYEYRGEYGISGRYYFAKSQPNKFHLHIYAQGAESIKKHLNYVKVMSENPKYVEEFNDLKQKLL